ncbi:hypothetical protein T440DRAFT_511599 [Plenodomus tracheiphilus IPT5]|uniref:Zn(2)-C6 fungal-type domain-containing protein n=1 Tax=Plenodomus tracheiphilus IPT5 TaxID=1408161 RepID=A0A6A7AQL1_9PLEO|nr:hypothetical protein T440DRAFT_511599 [Plenodomus tracheiphilus IPT5]
MTKNGHTPERKRRAHVKSRSGCGNCKLRRVKCDESRPCCAQCKRYGVHCKYGTSKDPLDLSAQGSFERVSMFTLCEEQSILLETTGPQDLVTSDHVFREEDTATVDAEMLAPTADIWYQTCSPPIPPISTNSMIAASIDNSLQSIQLHPKVYPGSSSTSEWHFTEAHLEIMERFQTRTGPTIGDKRMAPEYQHIVSQLAISHSFLMHMVLGVTLMHDADLALDHSPTHSTRQKHASLRHWSLGTSQLNKVLTQPIPPSYRDAIWATGVHIGAASFWYTESTTNTTQAWPLKPSEPTDLSWLKLGQGKKHLWRLAQPTRSESLFHDVLMMRQHRTCFDPLHHTDSNSDDVSLVPERVRHALGMGVGSGGVENVYYLPAVMISRLQGQVLTHGTALLFLRVTSHLSPEFYGLLQKKDARAVFLLGWWFQTFEKGEVWWMARRAKVEGEAVRVWLRRHDGRLAELLDFLAR